MLSVGNRSRFEMNHQTQADHEKRKAAMVNHCDKLSFGFLRPIVVAAGLLLVLALQPPLSAAASSRSESVAHGFSGLKFSTLQPLARFVDANGKDLPTALIATYGVKEIRASALGSSIASVAEGQDQSGAKVVDSPANSDCNLYTAYWGDGSGCSAGLRANPWCADFAAWVWRQAGASFTYGSGSSDINAWSASFYFWGLANDTWHPLSSGYTPQPGDAAIYGNLTETSGPGHVGIVTGGGNDSPNVVSGNWATSWPNPANYGVMYQSDVTNTGVPGGSLDGYVSPVGGATPPAPPTSVSASPLNGGEAQVSWNPGSDGGNPLSYSTVTSNPPAVSLSYDPSYNSIILGGLTTGTSYTFTVTETQISSGRADLRDRPIP